MVCLSVNTYMFVYTFMLGHLETAPFNEKSFFDEMTDSQVGYNYGHTHVYYNEMIGEHTCAIIVALVINKHLRVECLKQCWCSK